MQTFPVEVKIEHCGGSNSGKKSIRCKYLYGADGADSSVRKSLKIPKKNQEQEGFGWAVIDGVVDTDFPQVKVCLPTSKNPIV